MRHNSSPGVAWPLVGSKHLLARIDAMALGAGRPSGWAFWKKRHLSWDWRVEWELTRSDRNWHMGPKQRVREGAFGEPQARKEPHPRSHIRHVCTSLTFMPPESKHYCPHLKTRWKELRGGWLVQGHKASGRQLWGLNSRKGTLCLEFEVSEGDRWSFNKKWKTQH